MGAFNQLKRKNLFVTEMLICNCTFSNELNKRVDVHVG